MTPREIIRANIECRCEGRIGFNFVGVPGRRNDILYAACRHTIETRRWEEGPVEYYTDVWGNTWHCFKGVSKRGEVFRPALQEWSDLDRLRLPDLDNPAYFENARQSAAADTEHFRVGDMPGWPFATCRYMRKMEIYLGDLIAEREHIQVLHEQVTGLLERVIARFGEAGMDGIIFAEDLGLQDRPLMRPQMWRELFQPLYERLTSRAHGYGMKVIQHSCGFNWALIDDLCDAGIDCLQFDQPLLYDLDALAGKLRRRHVGLFSPCDIQKVLPTGDKALIERETERLTKTFRGGFIAMNYTDLPGIGVKPEWDQWAYDAFCRADGGQALPFSISPARMGR